MQIPVDKSPGLPLAPSPPELEKTAPKDAGGAKSNARLNEAAKAFEGAFLKILLKSMRDTIPEGGMFDRQQMAAFEEMRDGALADSLAGRGATGIAQMVVRQLGGTPQANPATTITLPQGPQPGHIRAAATTTNEPASSAGDRRRFVDQLLPAARKAASALGVDAAVIVAQAALETGWGKHIPGHSDGGSSNNLFGVKAGGSWQGKTAAHRTTEYLGGKLRKVVAEFRAYASPQDSIADYIKLITSSPRYAPAANATSADHYLQALQDGGYATDPGYAGKIKAILRGPELRTGHDH